MPKLTARSTRQHRRTDTTTRLNGRRGGIPATPTGESPDAWRAVFDAFPHLQERDGAQVLQLLRVERDVAAFREVLAVEGRIIAGRSGATVHPAARALHQSETLLLAIRSSLTMTPRMRAQLSVADLPEDESPLDALLQQWRRPATPPQTPEPKTDDDAA